MSKVSVASFTVLCAALAACSDANTTAPAVRPALGEASADFGLAYTIDGPSDAVLATEDASAQLAGAQVLGAQLAAAPRAASGSRSSGHVGFPTGWAGTPIQFEKYSYTALSTDPATLAAKGQFEISLNNAGVLQRIHGDVICMNVFGNTARVGGQITKVWVNDVPTPINPLRTHAIWVVVDNGEGATAPPDQVSLMRFGPLAAAQTYCATGFLSFVSANQEGNIQVQP